MATITTFTAGHCNHYACVAYRNAGRAKHRFPARAFLISTRSGPFLWDTGFARHYADGCRGLFRIHGWLAPADYHEDSDALATQLRACGVRPQDLRGLVMSHLHADHIAGVRDFPEVPLWAAAEAADLALSAKGLKAFVCGYMPSLMPHDTDDRLRRIETLQLVPLPAELAPFKLGWDISGTGELLIVPLPGHAFGHIGAFIQTDAGWVMLASDASWSHEAYRDEAGPAPLMLKLQVRPEAYLRTLDAIKRLSTRGVRIMLTHDC